MDSTDIHLIDNPQDPQAYKHYRKKIRLATVERNKKLMREQENG